MAYKALYRTYRPQKFSEVIGQEAIVRTLQNALATGKITHAYLFSGPRGTGKTTVARILAKAINCDHSPTSEPCGECLSCKEISEGNNPDVIEIDAASNNGVDEIRDIREKVKFLPGGSKYKIYIIDEVHMLSQGAFNALLKTLEEPPKHVIFILATTEPHKVLPTIISRCQRYDFKALSVKEIADLITKVANEEEMKISKEAIVAIAEGAEGGMRDALSYLDQAASFTDDVITIDDVNSVTGNLNYDKIIELAHYFENKNITSALNAVNDLVIMGKEINKIVSSLLQFYRDILLYKNIDTSMLSKYIYEKEDFKLLAKNIDINKIFFYVDVLSDVQVKIKTTLTPHIYLEVALIKMINTSSSDFNFVSKIKDLEEKITKMSQKGFTGVSSNENTPDLEKINALDNKLNRVIAELSKLELHKLTERVNVLESSQNNTSLSSNLQDGNEGLLQNERISKIQDELKNIKVQIEKLSKSPEQNDLQQLKVELENLITLKLKEINWVNKDNIENNQKKEENDLKEKISQLESKVYKLMSGYLANQGPQINKKPKQKISEGQIVLFGDEVVDMEEINKPIKEKVDFDQHQKSPTETLMNISELPEKDEETIEPKNDNSEVNVFISEEPSLPEENLQNGENNQLTLKDFENYSLNKEIIVKPILPVSNLKVSDLSDEKTVTKVIEDKVIVEKPNSQLVKKVHQEKPIEEKPNLFDKQFVLEQKKPEPEVLDEYSKYSVTIIERILHNSRNEFARNDKARLANLWRSLDKSVNRELKNVAELLQDGQIVAVGEREFIMVYPNAAMCNQVMKTKFKKDSLKLLYDFLGDTYNYIALPEELWKEKRMEYINQYNIGIRFPKLTPINDPNLNVEKENPNILDNQEKSFSKILNILGENIVKIE